ADIPGLIEGAHRGRGLGDKFLKHVERTRVLLQLVDCSELAAAPPVEAFRVVRNELQSYSPALAGRPSLVVATKVEDDAARVLVQQLASAIDQPVLAISAVTNTGLRDLLVAISDLLRVAAPG
ncbi:MAG TPA: GTPase, partial [Planctomycetota bacterium]|nr:GTPase [Planctomycetota bacterium]